MFSEKIHRNAYIFFIILLGISIPLSPYLTSISQFLIASNWLLEMDFINKWKRIKSNKPALYLMLLFILHLVWLINTADFDYAWHDIRIKVPLFVLGLLIGSSKPFSWKELRLILNFSILSVLSSTIISAFIYFGATDLVYTDVREISIFISHIRLSLLINIALFTAYYLLRKSKIPSIKYIYTGIIIWLIFFLYILNAYTGLLIFSIVLFAILIRLIIQHANIWTKRIALISLLTALTLAVFTSYKYINTFYNFDKIPNKSDLPIKTVNGNKYIHKLKSTLKENGHYTYLYYCRKEIKKEWNKQSELDFDKGIDAKGNSVRFTLINYLSSLNLPKDSLGFSKLKNEDILMIESGCSNYIYKDKYSLYSKVYPILKQINLYNENGYADGASVTQRVEYLKIAKNIIRDNFWFGTGTGDVDMAFKKRYTNKESVLKAEFQHRAHNQFITLFISFGFFGFILSIILMYAPIIKRRKHFLPLVFTLTAFLSMLNEDTLETQAGLMFFVFYYALFFIAFSFNGIKKGHPNE